MNKQSIKLKDISFAHSPNGFCCSDTYISDLFFWDRSSKIQKGDTVVFTDLVLNDATLDTKNIAWLLEPIAIAPQNYSNIRLISNRFEKIFTHEKTLLDIGSRYEFVPIAGCWIQREDYSIYDKHKKLSIIASSKRITDGHILRHDVINRFQSNMDVYGMGRNPIPYKLCGLQDYMFSMVIENCKRDYAFTEKLIDALVCGTVPIYWGCPSIDDFFDTRGFIIFDSINDLDVILKTLNAEKYDEMLPYVKENFERAKNYVSTDDLIFKKICALS